MTPTDLFFYILEDDGVKRGEFDIQLGAHGEILNVFIGGVKVKGQVDVKDFIELLLGQGYLLARSEKALDQFEQDKGE